MAKATKERVYTYVCPVCGSSGLRSKRGVKRHCTISHPGHAPFEDLWKECQALSDKHNASKAAKPPASGKQVEDVGEATETAGSQQEASQVPPVAKKVRGIHPARKMVKFDQELVTRPLKAPPTAKRATKAKVTEAQPPPKAEVKPPVQLKPVPTPPAPVAVPTPLTIQSVPKGAVLRVDGNIYYQVGNSFLPVKVEGVLMTVGLRQASPDGRTWLFCKVDEVVYGMDERIVLSGEQVLVSLPPLTAVPDVPPEVSGDVEEPVQNIEYRTGLPSFLSAVIEYHEVKEQEAGVKKLLKAAREAHYDHIFDFTKDYGSESEKDRQDYMLRESGYRSWLQRVPGRVDTKRNEAAIIQWCIDNGQDAVLCRALDVQAWDKLKETGVVPESVVQLYETQIDVPDTFRLSLTRETGDE